MQGTVTDGANPSGRAAIKHAAPASVNLYIAVSTRLYREGLVQALSDAPQLNVIGASGDSDTMIGELGRLRPDIVLVDVSAEGFFSSIQVIKQGGQHSAQRSGHETRVVALAVPDAPGSAIACAEAGVSGYVTRDGSIGDLVRIILSAHVGEFECSPSVAAALAARVSEKYASARPERDLNCLTQRELQIIRLLEHGLSNKAIARDLSITVPTVKNHVHHIIEKLNVRGRCEAAALYRRLSHQLLKQTVV